jgi:hypothetical protein
LWWGFGSVVSSLFYNVDKEDNKAPANNMNNSMTAKDKMDQSTIDGDTAPTDGNSKNDLKSNETGNNSNGIMMKDTANNAAPTDGNSKNDKKPDDETGNTSDGIMVNDTANDVAPTDGNSKNDSKWVHERVKLIITLSIGDAKTSHVVDS